MSGSAKGKGCVVQVLPDLSLAGAERMAEYLSIELRKRGWRVVVASLFDKRTGITDELERADVEVRFLGKHPGLDLSMISKLKRLLRDTEPAVVHSHRYCMQYTVPAGLGLSCSRVHTVHNMAEREVPKRIQAIQRLAFHGKKVVPVAINETVRDSICDLYGLPEESVPVVYNGVPPYNPGPVANLPGNPDAFAFLSIGGAMPQKNQLAMVRAFARFHERNAGTKLLIIGDGELYGNIADEIKRLNAGSYIFQLGQLPNARDYCYAVDAFLLPSLYEGMPMTIIEAMMAGLPVLASDRGGSKDMIHAGETGYLCETDEKSIANALQRLYGDPMRLKVAAAGKAASERYTASAMADGYERVYSL